MEEIIFLVKPGTHPEINDSLKEDLQLYIKENRASFCHFCRGKMVPV